MKKSAQQAGKMTHSMKPTEGVGVEEQLSLGLKKNRFLGGYLKMLSIAKFV
jgi:hypothetical protein